MKKVTPLPRTEDRTIAYWAERKVMSRAVDRCKSWKKNNYFWYADWAVARKWMDMTEEEFVAQRDAYIAENPMKFSPTTKTLWRA